MKGKTDGIYSDILHPNRANISKDDLRAKLAELYKANKDQVNVFGLQTQFGGGKTTGFALIYDSPEALKKFEPHYRLVRVGFASKIEKPSRQQRTFGPVYRQRRIYYGWNSTDKIYRQATQEQTKDSPWYGKGQGCEQEEGQIDDSWLGVRGTWRQVLAGICDGHCVYALASIDDMHGCIKEQLFRIVAYSIEPFDPYSFSSRGCAFQTLDHTGEAVTFKACCVLFGVGKVPICDCLQFIEYVLHVPHFQFDLINLRIFH